MSVTRVAVVSCRTARPAGPAWPGPRRAATRKEDVLMSGRGARPGPARLPCQALPRWSAGRTNVGHLGQPPRGRPWRPGGPAARPVVCGCLCWRAAGPLKSNPGGAGKDVVKSRRGGRGVCPLCPVHRGPGLVVPGLHRTSGGGAATSLSLRMPHSGCSPARKGVLRKEARRVVLVKRRGFKKRERKKKSRGENVRLFALFERTWY